MYKLFDLYALRTTPSPKFFLSNDAFVVCIKFSLTFLFSFFPVLFFPLVCSKTLRSARLCPIKLKWPSVILVPPFDT